MALDAVQDHLKRAGLRATSSRLHILRVLEGAERKHLSADEVYRELVKIGADVGYATVYRALTQCVAAGLAIRHNFAGGPAIFELADDEHHDHMICMETGRVIEFQNDRIEVLQKQIAKQHGYDLVGHSLVLYVRPRASRRRS